MTAAPDSFLFVYGTLRRAVEAPAFALFAKHATYFDEGSVHAIMYDFGAYPGVVLSDHAEDRVKGEVYALKTPRPTLALLDRYEGVAGTRADDTALYERVRVAVATHQHGKVTAWMYVYLGSAAGRPRIESGDYLDHLRRNPDIRPPGLEG
ncbi:MAG: gamma-glutamylcyclotransferase family protein [Alphaproteobacteria bacterium]